MPNTVDRPSLPGESLASYYTRALQMNPDFQLPKGYVLKGGRVVKRPEDTWDKIGRYAALAGTGVAAYGAGGVAAGAMRGGSAAGGATPTVGGTTGGGAGIPGGEVGEAIGGAGGNAAGGGYLNWLTDPGNLQTLFSVAGDVGGVLGGASEGAAQGRALESTLQGQRDIARNQQYGVRQNAELAAGNLDLNRKNFTENARGGRARQAMTGNLLSNLQDLHLSVPGVPEATVTGGLRPSALGAGGQQSASELARSAMLAQMAPDTFAGGKILEPPPLSEVPQASGWEKAAGVGGNILSILGALANARGRTPTGPVRS